MGIRMNVKKIRRLMRKYKLTCPIRKSNPYRRLQRSIRMGSQALCGCLFILVENILPGKRSSLTPSTTQRRNPPTKTAIAPHKSYSGDERIAYVEPVSWRIAEAVSALSIIAIVATVAVPRISR